MLQVFESLLVAIKCFFEWFCLHRFECVSGYSSFSIARSQY